MKPSFPAYFSNLEGFALFHPQERMPKFEYKRPTQFSRFHAIVARFFKVKFTTFQVFQMYCHFWRFCKFSGNPESSMPQTKTSGNRSMNRKRITGIYHFHNTSSNFATYQISFYFRHNECLFARRMNKN